MEKAKTNIEYHIVPPKKFKLGLNEMIHYKELFFFFTWRDIKIKYKQTILGFFWAILQPFLMMMVFVVFFSKVLKIPTDNIPAPVFYFSGLLYWNMFSSGVSGAANSMVENANIIKKVYFPRLIIPISSVLVSFFDFLMASVVFVGILCYYWMTEAHFFMSFAYLFYVMIALVLTLLTSLGLGTLIASLNVKYRDFRYIIPFMIQVMMFISPVIYPVSILNDLAIAKYIFALNPLTGALNLSRAGLLPGSVDWILVIISFISAMLIFIVGLVYFRKTEAYFADLA